MAANIHPWHFVGTDATTAAVIGWTDEAAGADGSTQTLAYGTDSTNLSQTATSTGTADPHAIGYAYEVTLTGLTPGTTYHAEIQLSGRTNLTGITFKTHPSTLPTGGFRVVTASDFHAEGGGSGSMTDPTNMSAMIGENPDHFHYNGDVVSSADAGTATAYTEWYRWIREYIHGQLNANEDLTSMSFAVGNHEVGNGLISDPSAPANPDNIHRHFFPTMASRGPDTANYYSVAIGDYLQLIILDSHSANLSNMESWLSTEIDDTVDLSLQLYHAPTVTQASRSASDKTFREDHWRPRLWPIWDAAESVKVCIDGHMHIQHGTPPFTVRATDPGVLESFELTHPDTAETAWGVLGTRSGETVESGFLEIGQGWRHNRALDTNKNGTADWFTDWVHSETLDASGLNFQTVDVGSTGVTVRDLDGLSGTEMYRRVWEYTYLGEERVRYGGAWSPPN